MTTFQSPVRVGNKKDGFVSSLTNAANSASTGCNLGTTTVSQTGLFTVTADLVNETIAFELPPNSQIIDIIADVLVVYNPGAGTATLTAGTAAAGTQYASGVDVKTATGRIRPTFTAAQLTNMANIGSTSVTVFVTIAKTTTNPSTGSVRVTIVYTTAT
jgi:hypothetical protein